MNYPENVVYYNYVHQVNAKRRELMINKTVKIDKSKCDGCGLCISVRFDDAAGLVDGKPQQLDEEMCDGLGNCLPVCPKGAISYEELDPETTCA